MFLFFDFFARSLDAQAEPPRDQLRERREVSMATRRVHEQRRREQAAGGKR